MTKRRIQVKHEHQLRAQIEEECKSKYIDRINHLVGANNELMRELEQYELTEREFNGEVVVPLEDF